MKLTMLHLPFALWTCLHRSLQKWSAASNGFHWAAVLKYLAACNTGKVQAELWEIAEPDARRAKAT
jgi:hypothetical protein